MKPSYLEFVELDDYLAHLRTLTNAPLTTHCEITNIAGKPDKFGIASVTYYAALTYRYVDCIVTCAIPILNTTTFHLKNDHDETHAKLHANFDKVRAMLVERGVQVARGKWMLTAPIFLSER